MAGADVRVIADRALVLEVSAADLPDAPGAWLTIWDEWTEDRRPRLIVVHDVDASSEDLEDVAAVCQEWVGEDSALALRYLPLHDDDGSLAGLLDLLTEEVRDYSSGELQISMCDPEHRPAAHAGRSTSRVRPPIRLRRNSPSDPRGCSGRSRATEPAQHADGLIRTTVLLALF